MVIWKYSLGRAVRAQYVVMPLGAKILSVQLQRGVPQMWVLVDEREKTLENRKFRTYYTGGSMVLGGGEMYVATYQKGDIVFHLFEVPLDKHEDTMP